MSSKYEPLLPHLVNNDEDEFIKTLTPKELSLHNLAIQKLGSSYFVWKSHAFQAWKQSKNANSK
jgi:hypothetical protein